MTERSLLRLICVFAGFVEFYLCFNGTWVHVVVGNYLLGLVYVYGDCGFLLGFLAVPRYMLRPKKGFT